MNKDRKVKKKLKIKETERGRIKKVLERDRKQKNKGANNKVVSKDRRETEVLQMLFLCDA